MTRTTLMAACWQLWLNLGQEMYSSAQVINLPMRKATGITTAQVMCVVFYLIWRTLFFGGKGLLSHTVDLVADNGDRAYGTVKDTVFILTCDEYRKYRDYIPHYDRWVWTSTPWYCGDNASNTGYADYVRGVGFGGKLRNNGAYNSGAVATACVLNPKSLNLRRIWHV